MSEQSNQQSGQSQRTRQGQAQSNPFQSERGSERGQTTIQETVVSQISGIAAQEVEGIRMGGGLSQRASGLVGGVAGGSGGIRTQGVSVEVGQEEAAVDLTLTVEYGRSVPQVTDAVRRNVANRVESLVGLRVTEVNVDVVDIFFPEEEQSQ